MTKERLRESTRQLLDNLFDDLDNFVKREIDTGEPEAEGTAKTLITNIANACMELELACGIAEYSDELHLQGNDLTND